MSVYRYLTLRFFVFLSFIVLTCFAAGVYYFEKGGACVPFLCCVI